MSFVISTDTSADLPTAELVWRRLHLLPFSYIIDGCEYRCAGAVLRGGGLTGDIFTDFFAIFPPILAHSPIDRRARRTYTISRNTKRSFFRMTFRICCDSCLSMCCMGTLHCAQKGHTLSHRAA